MSDNRALSAKRAERPYRETPDVADAVGRLIRTVGRRVADQDPEDLVHLQALDAQLEKAWALAIAGIRQTGFSDSETGFSDSEIGAALGVSKQAVAQRWPREKVRAVAR
jgi:hypothetical protein